MPHQANTDENLARAGGKQRGNGARLLTIGALMVAVGLAVFLLLGDADVARYVGLVLIALGAPPTIAGTALTLSGVVSGRASKQKPFA